RDPSQLEQFIADSPLFTRLTKTLHVVLVPFHSSPSDRDDIENKTEVMMKTLKLIRLNRANLFYPSLIINHHNKVRQFIWRLRLAQIRPSRMDGWSQGSSTASRPLAARRRPWSLSHSPPSTAASIGDES